MKNDSNAFHLLAIGHYGAEDIEVVIRLRSARPEKRLLELSYLQDAVTRECERKRQQLEAEQQYAATRSTAEAGGTECPTG